MPDLHFTPLPEPDETPRQRVEAVVGPAPRALTSWRITDGEAALIGPWFELTKIYRRLTPAERDTASTSDIRVRTAFKTIYETETEPETEESVRPRLTVPPELTQALDALDRALTAGVAEARPLLVKGGRDLLRQLKNVVR